MENQKQVGLIRINGFSNGFHPLQIFAYLVYISALIVFAICVFPYFDSTLQIISGVLYYISLGIMAILAFMCSYSDPTDPIIRKEKLARKNNIEYETIEYEYYCSTCISHVQDGSKHCRQCDRCVNGFDHHCKWLNNCIGKENYRIFYLLIGFVFINSVIYCIFLIYSLKSAYGSDYNDNFSNYSYSSYIVMKIFVWVYLIFVGFFGLLDVNLFLFHTWLSMNNLTTYEYIINSRAAKQEQIPYGICSGTQEFKEFLEKQNQNNQQNENTYTKPKRRDTIQERDTSYIEKICCCLKKRKKKINSIIPIDFAEQNLESMKQNNQREQNEEEEEQDNQNNLNPFSQNIIEGLIEKSICNSADVQEEDLRTEIGRQDHNNQQQSLEQQNNLKNKTSKMKNKKVQNNQKLNKSNGQEVQMQNINCFQPLNPFSQVQDKNSQINQQSTQFYKQEFGSGATITGHALVNNLDNSPKNQSHKQSDFALTKNLNLQKLNQTDFITEQKRKKRSMDLFLQPNSVQIKPEANNHFNMQQIEQEIYLNSQSFRDHNDPNDQQTKTTRQLNNQQFMGQGDQEVNFKNQITIQESKSTKFQQFIQGDESQKPNKSNKGHKQSMQQENQHKNGVFKSTLSHRNTNEFSDTNSEKARESSLLKFRDNQYGALSPDHNLDQSKELVIRQINKNEDEKSKTQNSMKNGSNSHFDQFAQGNLLDNYIQNVDSNLEKSSYTINGIMSSIKAGEQTSQEKQIFINNKNYNQNDKNINKKDELTFKKSEEL